MRVGEMRGAEMTEDLCSTLAQAFFLSGKSKKEI